MKKWILLLTGLLWFISCAEQNRSNSHPTPPEQAIETAPNTPFNAQKAFQLKTSLPAANYPSSFRDTTICRDWRLSANQIETVLRAAKPVSPEEVHHLFDHLPCHMHGVLVQGSRAFAYSVNSGAWMTVQSSDSIWYFGSFKPEYHPYFLSTAMEPE
ncbi:MAG: hypothetical protein AAFV80_21380 [Bacteroidota bacterium]